MKTYKKIFIGGLGALTPIIMNLMVVDLEVLLINVTLLAVLGYAIRVIILFYIGGITAFLHKDETSPVKIFELGIVAPALITAMLNAGQIDVPKTKPEAANNPTGSIFFIATTYAQDNAQIDSTKLVVKSFSMPEETKIQQFWRGLFGINPRRSFFVIVGSYNKLEDAQLQVKQLQKKTRDFKLDIYEPYRDRNQYSIVIGGNLMRAEAIQLERKAKEARVFDEIFVWNMSK